MSKGSQERDLGKMRRVCKSDAGQGRGIQGPFGGQGGRHQAEAERPRPDKGLEGTQVEGAEGSSLPVTLSSLCPARVFPAG